MRMRHDYDQFRGVSLQCVSCDTELLQGHGRVLLQFAELVQELLEALRRAPRVLPLPGRQATASSTTARRQSRLIIPASRSDHCVSCSSRPIDRVAREGSAIGRVCPSICLLTILFMTLMVLLKYEHDCSSSGIEN